MAAPKPSPDRTPEPDDFWALPPDASANVMDENRHQRLRQMTGVVDHRRYPNASRPQPTSTLTVGHISVDDLPPIRVCIDTSVIAAYVVPAIAHHPACVRYCNELSQRNVRIYYSNILRIEFSDFWYRLPRTSLLDPKITRLFDWAHGTGASWSGCNARRDRASRGCPRLRVRR